MRLEGRGLLTRDGLILAKANGRLTGAESNLVSHVVRFFNLTSKEKKGGGEWTRSTRFAGALLGTLAERRVSVFRFRCTAATDVRSHHCSEQSDLRSPRVALNH